MVRHGTRSLFARIATLLWTVVVALQPALAAVSACLDRADCPEGCCCAPPERAAEQHGCCSAPEPAAPVGPARAPRPAGDGCTCRFDSSDGGAPARELAPVPPVQDELSRAIAVAALSDGGLLVASPAPTRAAPLAEARDGPPLCRPPARLGARGVDGWLAFLGVLRR